MRIEVTDSLLGRMVGRRTRRCRVWADGPDGSEAALTRVLERLAEGTMTTLVLFDRSPGMAEAVAELGLVSEDAVLPEEVAVSRDRLPEIAARLAPFSVGLRMTKRPHPPFDVLAVLSLFDDNVELESSTDPEALLLLTTRITSELWGAT